MLALSGEPQGWIFVFLPILFKFFFFLMSISYFYNKQKLKLKKRLKKMWNVQKYRKVLSENHPSFS